MGAVYLAQSNPMGSCSLLGSWKDVARYAFGGKRRGLCWTILCSHLQMVSYVQGRPLGIRPSSQPIIPSLETHWCYWNGVPRSICNSRCAIAWVGNRLRLNARNAEAKVLYPSFSVLILSVVLENHCTLERLVYKLGHGTEGPAQAS